jgi:hypothetical protein
MILCFKTEGVYFMSIASLSAGGVDTEKQQKPAVEIQKVFRGMYTRVHLIQSGLKMNVKQLTIIFKMMSVFERQAVLFKNLPNTMRPGYTIRYERCFYAENPIYRGLTMEQVKSFLAYFLYPEVKLSSPAPGEVIKRFLTFFDPKFREMKIEMIQQYFEKIKPQERLINLFGTRIYRTCAEENLGNIGLQMLKGNLLTTPSFFPGEKMYSAILNFLRDIRIENPEFVEFGSGHGLMLKYLQNMGFSATGHELESTYKEWHGNTKPYVPLVIHQDRSDLKYMYDAGNEGKIVVFAWPTPEKEPEEEPEEEFGDNLDHPDYQADAYNALSKVLEGASASGKMAHVIYIGDNDPYGNIPGPKFLTLLGTMNRVAMDNSVNKVSRGDSTGSCFFCTTR